MRTTISGMGMDGRVVLDVAPSDVLVSPRQIGSLAMILNELATNVGKHGGGPAGRTMLSVSASIDGSQLTLDVRDRGPGFPPAVLGGEGGGVGLKLVAEIVTGTLRGRVRLSNDHGAVVRIAMEMDEPAAT